MKELKKCIVWDLDNTIWDGICLEGKVHLRSGINRTIRELDNRGVLHSIASRGEKDVALKILKQFKLEDYFLVPQINWFPKYYNLKRISDELGIALDSIVFIDDDPFELEQIGFMLPQVLTINANKASELTYMSVFPSRNLTKESKNRRAFYQVEQERKLAEASYSNREDFLKSCNMKLKIRPMRKTDAERVLELMSRTHQLNTAGSIFNEEELNGIVSGHSKTKRVMTASLSDKFGSYGIIGVAITEIIDGVCRLIYLAISCRVMGRGIERALLTNQIHLAEEKGFKFFEATFRETGKNKMMRGLYQMMGFRKLRVTNENQLMIFQISVDDIPKSPHWVDVT